MNPMMKCGHAANGTDAKGNPYCVICFTHAGGDSQIVVETPDLSTRRARCAHYGHVPASRNHESNYGCKRGQACLCEEASSSSLPFFKIQPQGEYDIFYCGCWGWD